MGGVEKGWNGLVATFLSLVTVFGVLTPWLIVLVPVAVVLIVLWRGRKRRHDRKAGTPKGKDGASSPSAAASSSAATKGGESTGEEGAIRRQKRQVTRKGSQPNPPTEAQASRV